MPKENVTNHRRWIWYCAIALGIVGAIALSAIYFPSQVEPMHHSWVQLVFVTVVIFGYLLKFGWRYRSSLRFWALYCVFLVTHCVALTLLSAYGPWPIIPIAVAAVLETMVLAAVIAVVLEKTY